MIISWSDLNNVQDAGEYQFRDGLLVVNLSEIAIWRNNPAARFQLTRKNFADDAPRYVLGEQIDERLAPRAGELFYESSNGDSWSLAHHPATGGQAILHRPNAASGGHATHIEIEKFLSESADGPEHQALRLLLDASAKPSTILIVYDIHPPRGAAYDRLREAVKSLGSWWHHLETVWIVQTTDTPGDIRDRLKPLLGFDDQLLVIDISGDTAGWIGVNESGSQWLNENI